MSISSHLLFYRTLTVIHLTNKQIYIFSLLLIPLFMIHPLDLLSSHMNIDPKHWLAFIITLTSASNQTRPSYHAAGHHPPTIGQICHAETSFQFIAKLFKCSLCGLENSAAYYLRDCPTVEQLVKFNFLGDTVHVKVRAGLNRLPCDNISLARDKVNIVFTIICLMHNFVCMNGKKSICFDHTIYQGRPIFMKFHVW